MKHNIRNNNMLLAMLMLVAAVIMPADVMAQVTLTYISGSDGYSGEAADKLFDGDTSTKWCYTKPSSSSPAWVVFKASAACRLKGYAITTANDNSSNSGRNPRDWKIYGSNDNSSWTELVSVSGDTKLQDVNYTAYDYNLETGISTKYEYYKWEITANQGSGVFQVSEFSITVSNCTDDHHEGELIPINTKVPTCTEVGYLRDFYRCDICGRCYSDADGKNEIPLESVTIPATGHTFNGYNGDCSVCGISHMFSHTGTTLDPFQIRTDDDLYWFSAWVNGTYTPAAGESAVTHLDACAILLNDITVNTGVLNANGTLASSVSDFKVWTPIGNSSSKYNGTFDGQNHTVSGLYFNNSEIDYVGFFGYTNSSCNIANVGVVDSYFNGSGMIGGVCGSNFGTISNCYNTAAVSGSRYIGGVCGINDGTINNCYNTGAISGSSNIGGVCGYNEGAISNCYNTGAVSGSGIYVGSLCGSIYLGTISNCYFDINKCCKVAVGDDYSTVTNAAKTTDQFASGEVCYLLNNGITDGTQAWYQNLTAESGDKHPVLKNSGSNTVYASKPCMFQYSNTELESFEHDFDDDGFCSKCGGYKQANLTSDKYAIDNDGPPDNV